MGWGGVELQIERTQDSVQPTTNLRFLAKQRLPATSGRCSLMRSRERDQLVRTPVRYTLVGLSISYIMHYTYITYYTYYTELLHMICELVLFFSYNFGRGIKVKSWPTLFK